MLIKDALTLNTLLKFISNSSLTTEEMNKKISCFKKYLKKHNKTIACIKDFRDKTHVHIDKKLANKSKALTLKLNPQELSLITKRTIKFLSCCWDLIKIGYLFEGTEKNFIIKDTEIFYLILKKHEIMKQKLLYKKYIKDTPEKAKVVNKIGLVCHLTKTVAKSLELNFEKVYISTRAIKHLYDKKPAEEFNFVLANLIEIVKYPDKIYKNKSGKRGGFCLVKKIKTEQYLCSVEILENKRKIMIATVFRLRKENYIKNYKLLWSWRGDNPSS